MADRLAALFQNFSVRAKMFHAGTLCSMTLVSEEHLCGHLHLVRSGGVEVHHATGLAARVSEPSLLLYPRGLAHRFVVDPAVGADMVCAFVNFEGHTANPVVASLPEFVLLPLRTMLGSEPLLSSLFAEADETNCGRSVVLDRLFEVVLVLVLRTLMSEGKTASGMLAGMAHPKVNLALIAMHEHPTQDWSLADLADIAGMSRTAFAGTFRDVVGATPGNYLQGWRIGLAQKLLQRGHPLKFIATEVGYSSEAALSRAFHSHLGITPKAWRASAMA